MLVSSRDAREYGGLIAASGALGFVAKSDLSGDTSLFAVSLLDGVKRVAGPRAGSSACPRRATGAT